MRQLTVLALSALLTAGARAQVIYQDMAGMNLFEGTMSDGFNASPEEGDQLTLGPGSRVVIDAKSIIRAVYHTGTTTAFNFDITLHLRPLQGGVPGAELFNSTKQIRDMAQGAVTMEWSVPSVVVPDTVVMSFSFIRQGGNTGSVGIDFGGTPTIGSSDPNFYWSTGFSGVWQQLNFPVPNRANMAAELTAVPEPGTAACLGLCLVAARWRRRHKARSVGT
jgi:hypothetical protein